MAPHIRHGPALLPAGYGHDHDSPAYRDLIAGQFASMITEFTELDHELVVWL